MDNTKVFSVLALLFLLISACSYKSVPYFQDLDQVRQSQDPIANYQPIIIQPDDILGISVSSLNAEASAQFNYNLSNVTGVNQTRPDNPVTGFLVDEKGNIQLPFIGQTHVADLSIDQARALILRRLTEYLREPVVNIRLINFKVSVLGDVLKPGVYPVQTQKLTVLEALSMAGDLNITGIRNNVMLIRESQGKRDYIPLDLTSKNIFKSPYYYLKTNDVLYVKPGADKSASVDNTYRNAGILLSVLSIVAILLTR